MIMLLRILRSNRFFYSILGLFTIGCLWIATASLYPMAFDEEFHVGLIAIYASSWLPYGIEHTRDMAQYGAATGDPSYLFHYLMSFPYKALYALGFSDWTIIAALRIINLGFVIGALVVLRKVLIEAGIGRITTNVSMLSLMLIPVFSLLASQVNYDTLLLLVVAISFLLLGRVTRSALNTKQLPAGLFWALGITLLFGMAIKYALLPIVAAFGLWVIGLMLYLWKSHKISLATQASQLVRSTAVLRPKTKALLLVVGTMSLFFAAHYATNFVQYGHPIPDCSAVFDHEACTAYGPWNRNRNYVNGLSDSFVPLSAPAYLVTEWIPGMSERLTFSLAGKTNNFQTKQPLPLVLIPLLLLTIVSTMCLLYRIVKYRSSITPFMWSVLLVSAVYVGVLFIQLYGEYARTGQPVAINGRYLLLILPLLGAILLDSTAWAFRALPEIIKTSLVVVVVATLLIGGGGVITYIVQSENHWFWPGWGQQSHAVLQTIFRAITVRWQLFS